MADTITYVSAGDIVTKARRDDGTLEFAASKATGGDVDIDQQICDPAWLRKAVPAWMEIGNLREMHQPIAAGVATALEEREDGHYISGVIVDPSTAKKVELGVLKGLSIGIKRPRIVKDAAAPGGRIIDGQIVEISIVDRAANPSCKLTLAKMAAGSDTLEQVEELIEPEWVDVTDQVKSVTVSDGRPDMSLPAAVAEVLGVDKDAEPDVTKAGAGHQHFHMHEDGGHEHPHTHDHTEGAFDHGDGEPHAHQHEGEVPAVADPPDEADGSTTAADADDAETSAAAAKQDAKDKSKADADAKAKADAKADKGTDAEVTKAAKCPECGEELDGDEEVCPNCGYDLEDGKAADPDAAKRDFTQAERDAAAGAGTALPDGSFPIKNVGDLRNAVGAYGRASDKAAAKAHIKKRAAALNRTDLVPDSWKVAEAAEAIVAATPEDLFAQLADKYTLSDETKDATADNLSAARKAIAALIVTEAAEALTGDAETDDIDLLLDALKALRLFEASEASEGEITPSETPSPTTPDLEVPLTMTTAADLVKVLTGDDDESATARDDIIKALGIDSVIAEHTTDLKTDIDTAKAVAEDAVTKTAALEERLAQVEEMAAPSGPARARKFADTARAAETDEHLAKAAGYRRQADHTDDNRLRTGLLALAEREEASARATAA